MSDPKQEIAEILKVGIRTEIEGQNLYATMAQKIKNPETKKKVEMMAADEVVHEKRLRELYEKFVGGDASMLPKEGIDIFKDTFGDRKMEEIDKNKFLNLAMESELKAARLYKEGEDKATDPAIKKVFAELVAEEDGHYNMLAAEREALRGNVAWFSFEGQSLMEE